MGECYFRNFLFFLILPISVVFSARGSDTSYPTEVLSDSPVLYHRFKERSGEVAVDLVGGGDARFSGRTRLGDAGPGPALGGAAWFAKDPDSTGRLVLPTSEEPDFLDGSFAVEFWYRHKAGRDGNLFNMKRRGSKGIGLRLFQGGRTLVCDVGGDVKKVVVEDRQAWHHVVWVRENSEGRDGEVGGVEKPAPAKWILYLDGKAYPLEVPEEKDRLSSSGTSVRRIVLGCNWNSHLNPLENPKACWVGFTGWLDEFAVYDHALSAERIAAHFSAGRGEVDDVVDRDNDGLADWLEELYFGSVEHSDGDGDPDGDGLTNLTELEVLRSDPLVFDGQEKRAHRLAAHFAPRAVVSIDDFSATDSRMYHLREARIRGRELDLGGRLPGIQGVTWFFTPVRVATGFSVEGDVLFAGAAPSAEGESGGLFSVMLYDAWGRRGKKGKRWNEGFEALFAQMGSGKLEAPRFMPGTLALTFDLRRAEGVEVRLTWTGGAGETRELAPPVPLADERFPDGVLEGLVIGYDPLSRSVVCDLPGVIGNPLVVPFDLGDMMADREGRLVLGLGVWKMGGEGADGGYVAVQRILATEGEIPLRGARGWETMLGDGGDEDSDGDGLADRWESFYFLGSDAGPGGDPDGDGISNAEEFARSTNPHVAEGERTGESQKKGRPDGRVGGEVVFEAPGSWELGLEGAKGWSHGKVPGSGDTCRIGRTERGVVFSGTGDRIFGGDALVLEGEGARFRFNAGARDVRVSRLVLGGGAVLDVPEPYEIPSFEGEIEVLNQATVEVVPGGMLELAASVSGGGKITVRKPYREMKDFFAVGKLVRSGVLLAEPSPGFSGVWQVAEGVCLGIASPGALGDGSVLLEGGLLTPYVSVRCPAGKLVVGENGAVELGADLWFKEVSVNGEVLSPGSYGFAELAERFPGEEGCFREGPGRLYVGGETAALRVDSGRAVGSFLRNMLGKVTVPVGQATYPVGRAAAAPQRFRTLEESLRRAGENRPSLEAALEEVPGEDTELLLRNAPQYDLVNLRTDELVNHVRLAREVFENPLPYCDLRGDRELWQTAVLPYRILEEDLSDWRPVLHGLFWEMAREKRSVFEFMQELTVWLRLNLVSRDKDIREKSPLEILDIGSGLCREHNLFFVAALRSVGIPARHGTIPCWAHTSGTKWFSLVWDPSGRRWLAVDGPAPVGRTVGWRTLRPPVALAHPAFWEERDIYGRQLWERCEPVTGLVTEVGNLRVSWPWKGDATVAVHQWNYGALRPVFRKAASGGGTVMVLGDACPKGAQLVITATDGKRSAWGAGQVTAGDEVFLELSPIEAGSTLEASRYQSPHRGKKNE